MPADLCLLADEELLRRVENLPNLSPSKLADQVADMGAYFALIFALDDAVRVWDLGDRHLPSRPGVGGNRLFVNIWLIRTLRHRARRSSLKRETALPSAATGVFT